VFPNAAGRAGVRGGWRGGLGGTAIMSHVDDGWDVGARAVCQDMGGRAVVRVRMTQAVLIQVGVYHLLRIFRCDEYITGVSSVI